MNTTHRLDAQDCGGAVAPWLASLNACGEAVRWASDRDLLTAWRDCERAEWMLWLCSKNCDTPGWPTRQQLVLAACACAETVLRFVRVGENRPRKAIETARRWARGEAGVTLQDVRNADASAASAADAAALAAAAADADARSKTLAQCADIVRKFYPTPPKG